MESRKKGGMKEGWKKRRRVEGRGEEKKKVEKRKEARKQEKWKKAKKGRKKTMPSGCRICNGCVGSDQLLAAHALM